MKRGSSLMAHVLPFAVFMLLLATMEAVPKIFGYGNFWTASPQYFVFPVQTVVCGGLLWWFWSSYHFTRPLRPGLTLSIAVLVLALWVSPQEWLGAAPRLKGFDPTVFADPVPHAVTISLRFLRLVVVVPLVEEIFWRGFLLRHFINEDFEKVPFGTFTWGSFGAVSLCFALAHWGPDFWPALITGALYNAVAYRTRSLSSCVAAHAVTNLLLGLYIMRTRQWGFW